jgi:biotin carboxylase
MGRVPPVWLLKPRFEASATGIQKINSRDELWRSACALGDRQSYFLLEKFVPGDIFHVDSIISDGEVIFAEAHKYGQPPIDVAHAGGIFTTSTIERGSAEEQSLLALNRDVMRAMGHVRGVSHTEFIKAHVDGRFYFLETSARVGGANIVELVEAATGVNLWAEWAKIEIAGRAKGYELSAHRRDYAGIVISLAKQECPDTSAYREDEIVWRLNKRHHAGLIFASPSRARVETLMNDYTRRFYQDFYTSQPLSKRSAH